jgi:hypothetical protein
MLALIVWSLKISFIIVFVLISLLMLIIRNTTSKTSSDKIRQQYSCQVVTNVSGGVFGVY